MLKGKKKLVVLTGNAGDGKTAFIQLIEAEARNTKGTFSSATDNGCKFQYNCLLYTSDAADERSSVDLGGRRIIKKKKKQKMNERVSIRTKRRQNIRKQHYNQYTVDKL